MESIDNRTKKTILIGIFLFIPLLLFWAAPIIRQITGLFTDPFPQISILQNILVVLSIIDIAFPWFLEKVLGSTTQPQDQISSIRSGQKLFFLGMFFEVSPSEYGLLLFLFGSTVTTLYMFVGLSFVAIFAWGIYRLNADDYL